MSPFIATCRLCNAEFRNYTSLKSAKSCRDKHTRGNHRDFDLNRRRKSNAQRIAAARRCSRGPTAALAARARVLVRCLIRRALQLGLFTSKRHSFVDIGFPVSAVRRFQGIDLQRHTLRDGVKAANSVVTKSLLRAFVPKARAIWYDCPRVAYVLFAEDDCRFLPGVDVQSVLRATHSSKTLRGLVGLLLARRAAHSRCTPPQLHEACPRTLRKIHSTICEAQGARLGHGLASSLASWACVLYFLMLLLCRFPIR